MEETRGVDGGGGGQKGRCGMWDEEDEANNDLKKKHLHFNLEAEGELHFYLIQDFFLCLFSCLLPLVSPSFLSL